MKSAKVSRQCKKTELRIYPYSGGRGVDSPFRNFGIVTFFATHFSGGKCAHCVPFSVIFVQLAWSLTLDTFCFLTSSIFHKVERFLKNQGSTYVVVLENWHQCFHLGTTNNIFYKKNIYIFREKNNYIFFCTFVS